MTDTSPWRIFSGTWNGRSPGKKRRGAAVWEQKEREEAAPASIRPNAETWEQKLPIQPETPKKKPKTAILAIAAAVVLMLGIFGIMGLRSKSSPAVTVSADGDSGNDTQDRVFALNISETEKYFPSADQGLCGPTAYAAARGCNKNAKGNCLWWLRSPGSSSISAAMVSEDGRFSGYGGGVSSNYGVRPAMWIDAG